MDSEELQKFSRCVSRVINKDIYDWRDMRHIDGRRVMGRGF